ncbi:hypothetical protein [Paenibacillus bouchesdurhonensis]|uniref:hypothetical protein n=1 Tax=Paenibacillus bouchesdurhonensis TaxID=1870990 RepID=UPI000DA60384|nr:hypothetical protein [Paenibacillus bouchesdurhonensis]
MTEVRDWHKDKELVKEYGNSDMPYNLTEFAKMLPYYLQQYGVELRGRKRWAAVAKGLNDDLSAAEAREKKLREAIEEAINEKSQWGDAENALDVVTRHLSKTLTSLYPEKEGPEIISSIEGKLTPDKARIINAAINAAFEEDES